MSERASERAKAKQDILLAAIAEFSFHFLITLQRPMHQFDLLGKVFGRQEMEYIYIYIYIHTHTHLLPNPTNLN